MQVESEDAVQESSQWWLVRCPSCRAVLRVREKDLLDEEVIACSVCQELFRSPEQFVSPRITHQQGQASANVTANLDSSSQAQAEQHQSASANLADKGKRRRRKGRAKVDEKEKLNPDEYTRDLERKKRKKHKPKISTSMLFLVIFGLGILFILAIAFFQNRERNQSEAELALNEEIRVERDGSVARPEQSAGGNTQGAAQEPEQSLSPLERFIKQREAQFQGKLSLFEVEALGLVNRFLEEKSLEERLKFASPDADYLANLRIMLNLQRAPSGISSFDSLQSRESEGGSKQVNIRVLDEQARMARFVVLEKEGQANLDLAASFALGEVTWEELDQARGEKMMRLIIELSDYYNFEFRDNQRWQSWRISHPYADKRWYVYTEIGSAVHEQMMQILQVDQRVILGMGREGEEELRKRWTLLLEATDISAQHGQFEVKQLVSESWVLD